MRNGLFWCSFVASQFPSAGGEEALQPSAFAGCQQGRHAPAALKQGALDDCTPFLQLGTVVNLDVVPGNASSPREEEAFGASTITLAAEGVQVAGKELLEGSRAVGLITMKVGVQTAISAGVFVVVFLLIAVPVGIAGLIAMFMWSETKAYRPLEEDQGKDPFLQQEDRGLRQHEAPLDEERTSRLSRLSRALRSSGKWSNPNSFSQRSSRARSSNSRSLEKPGAAPRRMESPSLSSSSAIISASSNSSVLCPELLVQNPEGMTLLVCGQFEPYQQEEVIEVCNALDATNEVIVHVLLSESGKDSGILLESALRFPLAFLHTGAAVGPRGDARGGARQVAISRASAMTARAGYPGETHFAVAKALDANAVVLTHGGDVGGPVVATVRARPGSTNLTVADAAGKLIASLEPHRKSPPGQPPQHVLHVEHEVDLAIVLCAVIATGKLRTR